MRARRPDPEPLDVDAVKVVMVGTVLWGIALLASLPLLSTLRRAGYLWWVPTAACGLLLGLLGIWVCRRRAARLGSSGDSTGRPAEADELPPPLA